MSQKRPNPQYYEEERQILSQANDDWTDPVDDDAKYQNQVKHSVSDKHDLIEAELLGGIEHGGSLGNHRGGYLMAPNSGRGVAGGFLPAIPLMIAPLIASILGSGTSKGTRANVKFGVITTKKPLSMASGGEFYKSLARIASSKTSPKYVEKVMGDLLTKPIWNQIKKGKGVFGSGRNASRLLMGHLMSPILMGHARKALGRDGMGSYPALVNVLERIGEEDGYLSKPVTAKGLVAGGSILGTLWKGAKTLFGKLTGSKLAKTVGEAGSKALEKAAPALTENVIKKVTDYANKKLTDEDKRKIDMEDIDSMREIISKKDRKARAKKLLEKAERDDEKRRRRRRSSYDDDDDDDEAAADERELEFEPEDTGTRLRKEIVGRKKALVPTKKDVGSVPPGKRIIGYSFGQPIYGNGSKTLQRFSKKKVPVARGGAWTVKLSRSP